jgi:plasmid stabilization system protein ParE
VRTPRWADDALDQFDLAIDYPAARSPAAASDLIDAIDQTVALLAERPVGRPGEWPGTFEKPVRGTRYIVVYSLESDADGVLHILRIFHSSQDWTRWRPEPGTEP